MAREPVTLPFEFVTRWSDLAQLIRDTGGSLTDDEALSFLEERDRGLEDFIADFMPDLVFTLPGALTASTSPRFVVRQNYRVDGWIASLDTAGTSDTVIDVLVNGASSGVTLTIPSGSTSVTDDSDVALPNPTDYVQVEITTAGSGADTLTVQGILHR